MNSINFFAADQSKSSLDKIITWSLSYGRAIVMITELIALLAFLYRFGLDRQLSDLHDSIKQHQIIVAASRPAEQNFRNLQHRLVLIKQFNQQAQLIIQHTLAFIDQSGGVVQFTNFNISDTDLNITIHTDTTAGLNTFVDNLRNLPFVNSVSIDSIQSKQDTHQITAGLSVKIAQATN